MRSALIRCRTRLDPVLLLHTTREAWSAMVAATSPQGTETPSGDGLSKFLAKLPRLWRQGEVRPTHAVHERSTRHRRTRKGPFDAVWGNVLVWLQTEPDTTRKALMARLQAEHPDRLSEAQLQTVQRRVRECRGRMVKELVHHGTVEPFTESSRLPELALIGQAQLSL